MSASCEQVITLAGDLHARPAGALAVAAGRFASAVSVTAGSHTADAKSVLGVMGLGATSGQHVTVSAAGPDAQEAVAALITILTQATKVGGLLRKSGWPLHPVVEERGEGRLPDAAGQQRGLRQRRPAARPGHARGTPARRPRARAAAGLPPRTPARQPLRGRRRDQRHRRRARPAYQ